MEPPPRQLALLSSAVWLPSAEQLYSRGKRGRGEETDERDVSKVFAS